MYRLDKNYRIEPDGSYLKLIKEYEYEKVDKKTRKPTGEIATKEDYWWDQHIGGLLKKYLFLTGQDENTLEEVIKRFDNLDRIIKELPVLTQKDLKWN